MLDKVKSVVPRHAAAMATAQQAPRASTSPRASAPRALTAARRTN